MKEILSNQPSGENGDEDAIYRMAFLNRSGGDKGQRGAVGELKHLPLYLPEAISTLTGLTNCLRSPFWHSPLSGELNSTYSLHCMLSIFSA